MRPEFSLGLFTDFYELTMAQAFWQAGRTAAATFSLFVRKLPPDRGYLVFAGLADGLDYLENLRFTPADLDYLRSLRRFDPAFLDHLAGLRFTGGVRAMREGTPFFANEPVLEVTAPVIEAQLAETYLINQVNLQSILATKAGRVVYAAGGRPVIDFAARRVHGTEAADRLARVGYLVGYAGTSNTLAGARYGIPVSGTMAHSYVTSFESETEAFRHFARSFPDDSTLLVDTYDTLAGTAKAIAIARELKESGHRLRAIRLDSGDLGELSRQARAMLDAAGLPDVQIFASGGLDEFGVDDLVRSGAAIDAFGVGTKAGVSADAPWTDSVYKMVEFGGRPVLKLSSGKQTLPGPKQVFRRRDRSGTFLGDVLARADERVADAEPLLREVMAGGRCLAPDPSLEELRGDFRREFARLPDRHKALKSPAPYEVRVSAALEALRETVVRQTEEREGGGSATF
jgi:nicotinate phosphoribosyltransferase